MEPRIKRLLLLAVAVLGIWFVVSLINDAVYNTILADTQDSDVRQAAKKFDLSLDTRCGYYSGCIDEAYSIASSMRERTIADASVIKNLMIESVLYAGLFVALGLVSLVTRDLFSPKKSGLVCFVGTLGIFLLVTYFTIGDERRLLFPLGIFLPFGLLALKNKVLPWLVLALAASGLKTLYFNELDVHEYLIRIFHYKLGPVLYYGYRFTISALLIMTLFHFLLEFRVYLQSRPVEQG